jgi:hypothetical protein
MRLLRRRLRLFMWRTLFGIALSFVPRRWRAPLHLDQAIPWVRAAILSGLLESLLDFIALVAWYSRSVTHWAAHALDSALHNGPEAQVPGQAIGFSALVLWCLHPLTWFIAYFVVEGMVRFLAAVSTEQVLPSWPLLVVDWCYGKFTGRPPEGDALHTPTAKEQIQSLASIARHAAKTAALAQLPDELRESTQGSDSILEIHSCRAKSDWTPPRVVRIADTYYRLESTSEGKRPRPFIFHLRRLPAGVPGRSVLFYEPPPSDGGQNPS